MRLDIHRFAEEFGDAAQVVKRDEFWGALPKEAIND
jgi:hypothetical protein